jgi:DNA (cytosine-5)-methyltransferase 1
LFGKEYNIEANVYDAAEYGVAQRRTRAIIKLYRKGKKWGQPTKSEKQITVEEKIGFYQALKQDKNQK